MSLKELRAKMLLMDKARVAASQAVKKDPKPKSSERKPK